MKATLPACLYLALALNAHADVVELQNSRTVEGRVLSLFNQRLELAGKDGSISHVNLPEVKRIDFVSATATITTHEHKTVSGRLLGFKDATFILMDKSGVEQRVAAVEVGDLTVSSLNTEAPTQPPPPPARPKPAPASAAVSRPPARGSIQPERGKITIVDFYADWCGPCRKISPVLEKIAEGNSAIVLRKFNIDQHRDLVQEYNIKGIPHIIIYDKSGAEVDTMEGANEARVRKAIADASGS